MSPIQTLTRSQIRQKIGDKLHCMVLVTASTTGDTSSLIATLSLQKGGDDEYNGRQVYMATPVGAIAVGEKTWVSDFSSTNKDATLAPALTATVAIGDVFELWKEFTVEEINNAIDEAIIEVTDDCLQIKEIHNVYTESSKLEYNCLSSYKALFKVEWVYETGTQYQIHSCNSVWDEKVDGDVTASAATDLYKEGSGSLKLVAVANLGAGDIMATDNISSTDISDCDELEIWIYSSVALAAGDLQVLLDNTASCASAEESLNIPATTAATWTRHVISLANPHSDTAIISVGIKQITDMGVFTLYVDDIRAVKSGSRRYLALNPEFWGIAKGTTPYLKLEKEGLDLIGAPIQLRLTGLQIPSLLSADSTESEIDPAYIISRVTGRLLISHAKSSRLDIQDRAGLSKYWLGEAESRMSHIRTRPPANLRYT